MTMDPSGATVVVYLWHMHPIGTNHFFLTIGSFHQASKWQATRGCGCFHTTPLYSALYPIWSLTEGRPRAPFQHKKIQLERFRFDLWSNGALVLTCTNSLICLNGWAPGPTERRKPPNRARKTRFEASDLSHHIRAREQVAENIRIYRPVSVKTGTKMVCNVNYQHTCQGGEKPFTCQRFL